MRIAAFVSDVKSHLDFGGTGYLLLAQEFQRMGHDLIWFTDERVIGTLTGVGFRALPFPRLSGLLRVSDEAVPEDDMLATLIRRIGIDIVLSDRRLSRVGLLSRQWTGPIVAVGTPGIQTDEPPGDIWIQTADLNVVFMPARFYGVEASDRLISIRHTDRLGPPPSHDAAAGRVTVTLGNGGDLAKVAPILQAIPASVAVDVFHPIVETFTGSALFRELISRDNIRSRGWGDLRSAIAPSSFMVNLGGIASVWRPFADNLPQISCPGMRDDQAFNARLVREAGIGLSPTENGAEDWVAAPYEYMVEHHAGFLSAMAENRRTYTDDLQSAIARITAMA